MPWKRPLRSAAQVSIRRTDARTAVVLVPLVLAAVLAGAAAHAARALHGTGGSGLAPKTPCGVCGTNAIANAGAEQRLASGAPRLWHTTGGLSAVAYGSGNGALADDVPGPRARGRDYFAGSGMASANQTIALRAGPHGVSGQIEAALSGWFGGYGARLEVIFLSGGGRVLRRFSVGPVVGLGGRAVDGLRYRLVGAIVPLGAVSAEVVLHMSAQPTGVADEAADDLSLVLYVPGGA